MPLAPTVPRVAPVALLLPLGVGCAVNPAQPPVDLATHAEEVPIVCTNCTTPFARTRHYQFGTFDVSVTSSPRTERRPTPSGERRRALDEMRIEVSKNGSVQAVARCVDEYSYTQPSASSFAADIEDSYRCASEPGSAVAFSVALGFRGEDRYEGEVIVGERRLSLGSIREHYDALPGRVRGFTMTAEKTTLAAWRAQRGTGPELLWIGRDPAPSDMELALFLMTVFFQPGEMPL